MRRLAGETGADRVKTVYGLSHNRHVVNGRAGFSENKKGAGEGAFLLIWVFTARHAIGSYESTGLISADFAKWLVARAEIHLRL